MYCSNCGEKATGKYCSHCGSRIEVPEAPSTPNTAIPPVDLAADVPDPDWDGEVDYATLLQFRDVRERIARATAEAKKGVTAEEIVGWYEKAMAAIGGPALPYSKVMTLATPILDRIGFHTGKERTAVLPHPVARVLVAALCSLARNGQTLKQVHQAEDGCVLEASIPSNVWTMESELVVTFHRQLDHTEVSARTKVPGQLYDWGKSQKWLQTLFDDMETLSA